MKTLVVKKPWGYFEQFSHNEPSTVKILFIKKGEAFSLQYHNKRTEFWKIISGTPEITLGESVMHAGVGDEFVISPKTKHRVASVATDTQILEISSGISEEDDIVRLEDKYGRI